MSVRVLKIYRRVIVAVSDFKCYNTIQTLPAQTCKLLFMFLYNILFEVELPYSYSSTDNYQVGPRYKNEYPSFMKFIHRKLFTLLYLYKSALCIWLHIATNGGTL